MNALLNALSTSVGKKIVMAVTGLLLCGFLVMHLAGNLLLIVGEDAYNEYAHGLHSPKMEGLVKLAEVGLVALFATHIFLAVSSSRQNSAARKTDYSEKKLKYEDRSPAGGDTWMFVSGAVVLFFVLVHLADFTFEARPDVEYSNGSVTKEPFEKAVTILKNPVSFGVYMVGCIVLWFHLGHGVASALQTLGLRSPRNAELIRWGASGFAALIALGFLTFPLLANLGYFD
ncbi:MAG: succinate dehydrogenase cytochrome b subunit [Planctomycetota bacterium]|nr:succinate dehydrogenase cytochrome b subunit [Planctomycetota bacterium]